MDSTESSDESETTTPPSPTVLDRGLDSGFFAGASFLSEGRTSEVLRPNSSLIGFSPVRAPTQVPSTSSTAPRSHADDNNKSTSQQRQEPSVPISYSHTLGNLTEEEPEDLQKEADNLSNDGHDPNRQPPSSSTDESDSEANSIIMAAQDHFYLLKAKMVESLKFKGERGEQLETFISKFEKQANGYALKPTHRLQVMYMCLHDTAETWFSVTHEETTLKNCNAGANKETNAAGTLIPEFTLVEWKTFLTSLRTKFGQAANNCSCASPYYTARKEEGETWSRYVERLGEHITNHYRALDGVDPSLNVKVSMTIAKLSYILREQIDNLHVKDWSEFLTLIETKERLIEAQDSRYAKKEFSQKNKKPGNNFDEKNGTKGNQHERGGDTKQLNFMKPRIFSTGGGFQKTTYPPRTSMAPPPQQQSNSPFRPYSSPGPSNSPGSSSSPQKGGNGKPSQGGVKKNANVVTRLDGNVPMVDIKVNGLKVSAMLDSGADCSIVRADIAKEAGIAFEEKAIGTIGMADGVSGMPSYGAHNVFLKIGGHTFAVMAEITPSCGHQCIIGTDLLAGASFRLPSTPEGTGLLSIPVPPEVPRGFVHAKEEIPIPPHSSVKVEVKLGKPIRGADRDIVLATPNKLARLSKLLVRNALVSPNASGVHCVEVYNASAQPTIVQRDQVLAHAECVYDESEDTMYSGESKPSVSALTSDADTDKRETLRVPELQTPPTEVQSSNVRSLNVKDTQTNPTDVKGNSLASEATTGSHQAIRTSSVLSRANTSTKATSAPARDVTHETWRETNASCESDAHPVTILTGEEAVKESRWMSREDLEGPEFPVGKLSDTVRPWTKTRYWRGMEVQMGINCTEEQENALLETIEKFEKAFTTKDGHIGKALAFEYEIPIAENSRPIRHKFVRPSAIRRAVVGKETTRMFEANVIRPSNSTYASRLVVVRKKDGAYRVCIDLRDVNKQVAIDPYPAACVSTCLDTLSGANWFTQLDCLNAYHQIPLAESSKYLTAFHDADGKHWEFQRLPFGLRTAGAAFQRVMDMVLEGLSYTELITYLDDLCVFGTTFDELLERLDHALTRFVEHGLNLRLDKCVFASNTISFLGFEISAEGVRPTKAFTDKIFKVEPPKSVEDIRSYLGLVNFIRKHIRDLATITKPISDLLRKNVQFAWSDECQLAFEQIQKAIITRPILRHWQQGLPTRVWADASLKGLGAALFQLFADGWAPVAYFSRALSAHEANRTVYDLELSAAAEGMLYFKQYLEGIHFTLFTDNSAVSFMQRQQSLNGRLARVQMCLALFDFEITLVRTSENGLADVLSRFPADHPVIPPSVEVPPHANKPLTVRANVLAITRSIADKAAVGEKPKAGETDTLFDDLRAAQSRDEFCKKTIAGIPNQRPGNQPFQMQKGVLVRISGPKVCTVVPKSIRKELLFNFHQSLCSAHAGINKTISAIADRFFWPLMREEIETYVRTCHSCQMRKASNQKAKGNLEHIQANSPFEICAYDHIGPMGKSHGCKYILTFIDLHTKFAIAKAVPSTDARTVARFIFESVILPYARAPSRILSDQAKSFSANIVQEINKLFGIKSVRTTPYNPTTNGCCERFNGTLANMIAHYVDNNQTGWKKYVQPVVYAYNSMRQDSTGESPAFLLFGQNPVFPAQVNLVVSSNDAIIGDIKLMEQVRQEATARVATRHERNKALKDAQTDRPDFKSGDLVKIRDQTVAQQGYNKLAPRFLGPFKVLAIDGNVLTIDYRAMPKVNINKAWHYHPANNDSLVQPQNTTPRRKLGPSVSTLTRFAPLTFLAFMCFSALQPRVTAIPTSEAIVWSSTKHQVSHGYDEYTVVYKVVDGCMDGSLQNVSKTFRKDCARLWKSMVEPAVNETCTFFDLFRSKRGIPWGDIAYGVANFFMNAVTDYRSSSRTSDLREEVMTKLELTDDRARSAMDQAAVSTEISKKHNTVLQEFEQRIAKIHENSLMAHKNFLAIMENRFSFIASRVRSTLHYFNIEHVVTPDFQTVFPGLVLCPGCSMEHWHAMSCSYAPAAQRLILHFKVDRIDQESVILQAQPFRLAVPHAEQFCFLSYVGPKFTIFNTKTKCASPLPWHPVSDDQPLVALHSDPTCKKNKTLAAKDLWSVTSCIQKEDFVPLDAAQLIEAPEAIYVYCATLNISIAGHESLCGPSPYKVPISTNLTILSHGVVVGQWNTTSRNISGTIRLGIDWSELVNTNILPVWHPSQFLLQAEELIKENEARARIPRQGRHSWFTHSSGVAATVSVLAAFLTVGLIFVIWRARKVIIARLRERAVRLLDAQYQGGEELNFEPPTPTVRTSCSPIAQT